MPITKWFAKTLFVPGLLLLFSALLFAMSTNPEYLIPTATWGFAILGFCGMIVIVLDSVIGIVKLSSSIEKHAKLNIEKKELDFRETKQEKVILLTLENKEWMLDADDVEIQFLGIHISEGDENVIEQFHHQIFSNKFRLMWKEVSDQKSASVKLSRKELKELFFIETNKARDEFYVKVDPRGQRNNKDLVGGFPPGKYELDLMVRGKMPKRVVFWDVCVSVYYKGGNKLYAKFEEEN